MTKNEQDEELAAIQLIIQAMTPLDAEAKNRVLGYVLQRLNLALPSKAGRPLTPSPAADQDQAATSEQLVSMQQITDIRSFKEQKNPHSANEMTALVAFYLAELAPAAERKEEISAIEIEKYFKQGGYPLPAVTRMALSNAKNAGYLDAGSDRGLYKLNPVGHNLIAHNLPSAETERQPVRRRTKKTVSRGKKKIRKKKT